jgi:hypothetical protein
MKNGRRQTELGKDPCPMQGRRAPELAAGEWERTVMELLQVPVAHLIQAPGSGLSSQRLSCAQKHFCDNMYVDVSCGCCVMAHAVCHVSRHGRAMVSCRQCAPMQA